MIKKMILALVVAVSCLVLRSAEPNYTDAEKKFVCNFWEVQTTLIRELGRKNVSGQDKLQLFKKILQVGDVAILSSNCPKDFKQHWQYYSANTIPALNLTILIMSGGKVMTQQDREFLQKVENASSQLQKIYNKCKY